MNVNTDYIKNSARDCVVDIFCYACSGGNLKLARRLSKAVPSISRLSERTFRSACINGHLQVAKWLLPTIPKSDRTVGMLNDVLHNTFRNGHLAVAKWLLNRFQNLDVRYYGDLTFHLVQHCQFRRLRIWMCRISPKLFNLKLRRVVPIPLSQKRRPLHLVTFFN